VDGPGVVDGAGVGDRNVNFALFLIFPYPHAFDDVEEMGFPVGSRTLEITCSSFKKHTQVPGTLSRVFEVFKSLIKCIIWAVTFSFENNGDSRLFHEAFRSELLEFELIRGLLDRRGNNDGDGLWVLGQSLRLI
jgi:hypothetical protein